MNKKYYIFVGNEKIEVDQKIYQNYWQITNCIFRCGGAASPVWREPLVRTIGATFV